MAKKRAGKQTKVAEKTDTRDYEKTIIQRLVLLATIVIYFSMFYFFLGSRVYSKQYDWYVALDYLIPFTPFFIIFYLLGDLMVFSGILFAVNQKLDRAFAGYVAILTVSFLCFYFLPIEVKKPQIAPDGFFSMLSSFRIGIDTKYNAFPSLHVSLSTFSWLLINESNKKLGKWLLPLLVLVIISTVLVEQHLVADIAGGLIIAGVTWMWYAGVGSKAAESHASGK